MIINKIQYDEMNSKRFICFDMEQEMALSNLRHSLNLSSIDMFKKCFGEQKICKNYSARNWIWTFSDEAEKKIVYCLVSKEGISWESPLGKCEESISLRNEIIEVLQKNLS